MNPVNPVQPLTSLQRFYRRKAKWFFLGWCSYAKSFSEALARTRRRYPVSAAGHEFEHWAQVMFQREVEEALPMEGTSRPRKTLGHSPARPVPDATRTTPRYSPLHRVGCSNAAGLNSCNPQTPGVDEFSRPSDGQSDGLPPTKSE